MKIIPKEIKRRARAALTGYYFPAVSMTISLTLFTTALSLLVSASGLYGSPRPLGTGALLDPLRDHPAAWRSSGDGTCALSLFPKPQAAAPRTRHALFRLPQPGR